MKDFAIGILGLSVDEYYAMTFGNFVRRVLGHTKNMWVTQRELIALVASFGGEPVTGEDVFPFGVTVERERPTAEDREYMERRHQNTLDILNGRR